MLNKMDVIAPPNKAPQYRQDNRMMPAVGSIENVSGNRIATPFGPPSPGNTPMRMPSAVSYTHLTLPTKA